LSARVRHSDAHEIADAADAKFVHATWVARHDGVRIYERLGFTPFGPITEYGP
jgi:hypothetical protein